MPSTSSLTGVPADPSVIPVIEEQAEIVTVHRQTGALRVRVESHVVDEALALEHLARDYDTHRVPRGLPVAEARAPWHEGEVLVVPVYEEVEVVERRLILKEEIRLTPRAHRASRHVAVPLRKERGVIERLQADGTWQEVQTDTDATE